MSLSFFEKAYLKLGTPVLKGLNHFHLPARRLNALKHSILLRYIEREQGDIIAEYKKLTPPYKM